MLKHFFLSPQQACEFMSLPRVTWLGRGGVDCKRASWGQSGELREVECGPDPSRMGQGSQLLAPHENGFLLKSFLPSFFNSTTAS